MSSPIADPAEPDDVPTDVPGGPAAAAQPAGQPALPEPEAQPEHPEPEVAAAAEGDLDPYDAVLLLSFGGPEAPEEVLPFLRRVTAGRGIPDERLEEVGEHYYLFGGKSPINDQNRELIAALKGELRRRGIATPVLWGNRNSEPFLTDTLRDAYEAGLRRLVAVTTSAYSSYSSCRQYREDIAEAVAQLADEGREITVEKIRPYASHPSFGRTNTRLVTEAVRGMNHEDDATLRVLFVTHSIPTSMDDTSGPGDGEGNLYWQQHDELAHVILDEASATLDRQLEGALVYCSRSGPPAQPWLEPDVNDELTRLAGEGITHVAIAPIGFVSDHMEVLYDLDTEAAQTAKDLGLTMVRVPTVGTDPEFVSGLIDLVDERSVEAKGLPTAHPCWPGRAMPSTCAPGCCPNLRVAKAAACGTDGPL
ncbi:ferrochelatase [Dermacoccaceae bacterium W4C1]